MDSATQTQLEKEARTARANATKLLSYADSIERLLKQRADVDSLFTPMPMHPELAITSDDQPCKKLPDMVRFKRVVGTMSQADACVMALEKRAVPLSTCEIAATIRDLGLPVVITQVEYLGAVLSRKKDRFKQATRGKWALAEWKPRTKILSAKNGATGHAPA